MSHRFSLARHRRRHADVVLEDPIPDFGTLVMLFGEIVPAPRPLRPIRMERKKVSEYFIFLDGFYLLFKCLISCHLKDVCTFN